MKMRKLFQASLFIFCSWPLIASAAITLSADRLIYNQKQGDASLTVHSNEERTYLIQSWLDNGDNSVQKELPFVVTPPLFRLAANSDNVVRVVYLKNSLPQDRESIFWLNVKAIPGLNGEEAKVENRAVLAFNNRIKFFYRPDSLTSSGAVEAKNAHWETHGNQLTVSNASAYYLVLSKIVADGESIPVSVVTNNTLIKPFSHKSYTLNHVPAKHSTIEWQVIDDLGATSKTLTQQF